MQIYLHICLADNLYRQIHKKALSVVLYVSYWDLWLSFRVLIQESRLLSFEFPGIILLDCYVQGLEKVRFQGGLRKLTPAARSGITQPRNQTFEKPFGHSTYINTFTSFHYQFS